MRRIGAILAVALVAAIPLGCREKTRSVDLAEHELNLARHQGSEPLEALGYAQAEAAADARTGVEPTDYWEQQKLIRTAAVTLEVGEVDEAIEQVEALVEASGGMLADSDRRRGDADWQWAILTLRVPSEALDELLAALREIGRVRHESVSTEDVTKVYFDLETRLAVKRQTEERLRELLVTRQAELSDLIAVERELDRVVTEIEQMLGEKRFYDQRIAVSTVRVELQERGLFTRPGAFTPVAETLRDSVRILAESFAALIAFTVLALPWLLAAYVVWKLVAVIRRKRSRR